MRGRSGDSATEAVRKATAGRTAPPIMEEVVSRGIERRLATTAGVEPVRLSGSPVVPLPAHVVEAVLAPARSGGYAASNGEPELRAAIADTLRAEGVDARPEAVLVTNGAMQALDLSFRTLIEPGSAVLIPLPGFFIGGLVEREGGRLRGFPSPEEEGFRPDWDAVSDAVAHGARVLFLNTPVNPTGYVFGDEDLERALELAERHDLWVISDESYSHFVYDGFRHRTIAALPGALERTILIRSFSKDFAMPGWRLGYMLLPPALVEPITRTFEWSCLCVNRTVQAAGHAALTGPRDWIDEFVRDAARIGGSAANELDAIDGLRCVVPGGGLNLLVRCDTDADALATRLVVEHGVPVHPGGPFGAGEHFRMQFGAPDEAVREAIARVRAALQDTATTPRS